MSEPRHPVERSDLPPRDGVWFAKPRGVRWGLRSLPGYIACVWTPYYVALMALHLAQREMPRWITSLFFMATAVWATVWLVRFGADVIVRRRGAKDLRFSDRLPGLREYPVEVLVKEGGRALGLDRGVLWFDHGLLCFSGAATSFVISGNDVVERGSKVGKGAYEKLARDELLLCRPDRFATVRLMPLWGLHRFAYRRALRKFLQERRPVHRPRQWPPLSRYGEEVAPLPFVGKTLEEIGEEAARTGSARGVVRS